MPDVLGSVLAYRRSLGLDKEDDPEDLPDTGSLAKMKELYPDTPEAKRRWAEYSKLSRAERRVVRAERKAAKSGR